MCESDARAEERSRGDGAAVTAEALSGLFSICAGYSHLLVAVSGGSDSMALVVLLQDWIAQAAASALGSSIPRITVATVDHGLRAESAEEAQWVAGQMQSLGVRHVTLPWIGEKPKAGVQAAARDARYALLAREARCSGCDAIVTAHTQEDQAETVLMRLARGSSVDGLAGMRAVSRRDGLTILRPLLETAKAQLQATLVARRISWIEDPSNQDARFERVRLRAAGGARDTLALSTVQLAATARRMDRARLALDQWCSAFLTRHGQFHGGAYSRIDWPALRSLPDEIALRALQRVLAAYGGQDDPPRGAPVEALQEHLRAGKGAATLGGCRLEVDAGALQITREPGRRGLPELSATTGVQVHWDGRFRIELSNAGPEPRRPILVRGLGDDGMRELRQALDRAEVAGLTSGTRFAWPGSSGLPRLALSTVPAVWSHGQLVAVPHLGGAAPWSLKQVLPAQAQCRCTFVAAERLGIAAMDVATVG